MMSVLGCGRYSLFWALLFGMGGVSAPSSGHGQARARTPEVTAAIFPATQSIRPGSPLPVAIRLAVAPGWHIYWTNPGESGLPTTVRWTAPAGFTAGPIQWPYPIRKELAGVVVHAYQGEVVLLGEIRPPLELPAGKAVEISARLRWGVCREVCIPQEVRLSFSLPAADRPPRPTARWDRIAAAGSLRIPQPATGWVLRAVREEERLVLHAIYPEEVRLPRGPLTFFPEDATVLPAAISIDPERTGRGLVLRMKGSSPALASPTPVRLRGVLVAPSGREGAGRFRALRIDIPIERERHRGAGAVPKPANGMCRSVRDRVAESARSTCSWSLEHRGHLDAPAERAARSPQYRGRLISEPSALIHGP